MLGLVASVLLTVVLATGAIGASGASGASVEFAFTDPDITESSALVVDPASALFVTTNDSGDDGRIFAVDALTGDTVGVTRWRAITGEAGPQDVEALAPAGPGEVWVADIGDNEARRDTVRVVRVPVGRGDREVEVAAYDLVYPAGPRDAETLLVDPDGRLIVVTKGLLGGEVLRAEEPLDPDRPNALSRIGVALPLATDGAFFPDGRHFVLRGYGSAVIYAYPSLDEVGNFGLPDQQQGEGIAVDDSGAVFLSSEGERSDVLRVRLPRDVRRAMALAEPAPATSTPGSRSTSEPATEPASVRDGGTESPLWRWAIGGLMGVVGLGIVLVLVRSLRPRG